VLGCLIEKRFTTPDQYPLSLNALRLACNQATNRDPVVSYDEETVNAAAQRLTKYGVVRLASGHSSRATKYRHLAEEALGLNSEQLAVLCVLLLRGPQTPGELKQRTERMTPFASLGEVDRVLGELGDRGYARSLGRRPGQKEDRFEQLLGVGEGGGGGPDNAALQTERGRLSPDTGDNLPLSQPSGGSGLSARTPAPADDGLAARVAALEAALAEVREELADLRELLS
jgi:uncharacterized protein